MNYDEATRANKAVPHIPGPWTAVSNSWCETHVSAPSTSNSICLLDINHATEESQAADEAQMAANARLIAAAPELLEALKGLDDAFCRAGNPLNKAERHEDRMRLIAARAAIAKANGGAA